MSTAAELSEEEGDNNPVGGANVSDNEPSGEDDIDTGSTGSFQSTTETMAAQGGAAATNPTIITLGGMTIAVAAKQAAQHDGGVSLKKSDREQLKPDKRMALFNQII